MQGITEKCRPLPWVNNLVFVAKKTGGIRVCLDCTPANEVTKGFEWPLPRLQDLRHRLRGFKWFTRLDLTAAFFRIAVPPEYRNLLAFRSQDQTYRFLKMPFGVSDGPSVFQRFMDHILASHFYYSFWYIDDIIIGGHTLSDLRSKTAQVKADLLRAGNTVNEEKSEYDRSSVLFAGVRVSPKTFGPNKELVAKVLALPPPVTKTDRQSALGLVSYLRDFIPFCSMLTSTIHLGAREMATQPECSKEWAALTRHIASTIGDITEWDDAADADLYTDASKTGCGAILIQKGKVIAIASRKFTTTEMGRSYDTTARETLGLLLAAKKMKIFLHRARGVTHVWSDHSALLNRKLSELTPRDMRWQYIIRQWIPTLKHVPGKNNPADYISRWDVSHIGGQILV